MLTCFFLGCCFPLFALVQAAGRVIDEVVGGGVTDGARSLSHTISFWLTAILLSAMLAATAYGTRARAQLQSSRIGVYGPLCLMAVAALLVIADPLRRVLQDGGVWTGPSSSTFRDGCGEGWKCLSTTGILFMTVSRAVHNLTTE